MYYRKYVEKYAKIARPLYDLIIDTYKELKNKRTKNIDIQGKWNEKCEMSFNKLKLMLTTPPVLGIPDYNQDFVVETDASSEGLGAVLSQHQGDKFKVIAYASRALSKGEKNQENYSSKKVELLAVKWAICDVFRSYLLGSKTTLYTDNNPLTYIFTTKKLPAIEQRWLSALASFDIEIKYRPAKSNINADVLSRKSFGHQLNEVRGIVDLQEVSMNTIATDNDDNKITICDKVTPNIGEEQSNDATITELIEMIQQNKKPDKNEMGKRSSYVRKLFRQWKKLGIVNNVLCRTIDIVGHTVRQVVVPYTSKRKFITEVHDNLGHQGMARCLAILRQRCFWTGMHTDVDNYIGCCQVCTIQKKPARPVRTKMGTIEVSRPLEVLCMDFTTVDKSENGIENILVLINAYSKCIVAVPTKDQKATTVAKILVQKWFRIYGIPEKLHSDKGANFLSNIIHELCQNYKIKKTNTTPYHPCGNGIVERFNRTLQNYLRTLNDKEKQRWTEHIDKFNCIYNATPHSSTGLSPYFLLFGRENKLEIDNLLGNIGGIIQREDNWMEEIKNRQDTINTKIIMKEKKREDEKQRDYENTKQNDTIKIGSEVYVRKRVLGRNKIQNYWEEERWRVKSRRGNIYEVENAQSNRKIVNRTDIKICELDQNMIHWSYQAKEKEQNIWSGRLRPRKY